MLVLDDSRASAAEAALTRSPSIAGLPQPRTRSYIFAKSAGKQDAVSTRSSIVSQKLPVPERRACSK